MVVYRLDQNDRKIKQLESRIGIVNTIKDVVNIGAGAATIANVCNIKRIENIGFKNIYLINIIKYYICNVFNNNWSQLTLTSNIFQLKYGSNLKKIIIMLILCLFIQGLKKQQKQQLLKRCKLIEDPKQIDTIINKRLKPQIHNNLKILTKAQTDNELIHVLNQLASKYEYPQLQNLLNTYNPVHEDFNPKIWINQNLLRLEQPLCILTTLIRNQGNNIIDYMDVEHIDIITRILINKYNLTSQDVINLILDYTGCSDYTVITTIRSNNNKWDFIAKSKYKYH